MITVQKNQDNQKNNWKERINPVVLTVDLELISQISYLRPFIVIQTIEAAVSKIRKDSAEYKLGHAYKCEQPCLTQVAHRWVYKCGKWSQQCSRQYS